MKIISRIRQLFPLRLLLSFSLACLFTLTLFITPSWSLDYGKRNLIGHDFSGQDLRDSQFDHANLRDTDFRGANLQGVRLFSSNLTNANFEGADLRAADLESSRLTNANFKNAILEGAFAVNTLFNGANIEGADFTDILLSLETEEKLCEIASGTNPITGRNTKETLFCP
ncbi:MAG: pentapeptide repeat-containing protein [Microcystaceae cyanobacterium]